MKRALRASSFLLLAAGGLWAAGEALSVAELMD